jgi:hypothetical protein
VTVPDEFDLHIIQKNVTGRASVKWQHGNEWGVAFIHAPDDKAAQPDENALYRRIR